MTVPEPPVVIAHLARILQCEPMRRNNGYELNPPEFERRIIIGSAAFESNAARLASLAQEIFPTYDLDHAVALVLANYLDAFDATGESGVPLVLGDTGFEFKPECPDDYA